MKNIEFYTEYGKRSCYGEPSKINQIFNCTGMRNTCSTKDVDMLAIIEEIIENCWSWDIVNVCVIFDCVPGELKIYL